MSSTTVTFTGPKLCDIPAFLTLPVYAYHQNRDLWGLGEESNLCVKYNTLAITTTKLQTNKKHLNIQFLPFLGNPQPLSATRKISEIKPLLSQSKVPTLITLLQSWIIKITFNLLAQESLALPSLSLSPSLDGSRHLQVFYNMCFTLPDGKLKHSLSCKQKTPRSTNTKDER